MWKKYLDYLKNWAEEHEDDLFEGNSPASYDEWADNEAEEERNDSEWFGIVRWCKDDVIGALQDKGIEPTEENVNKIVDILKKSDWLSDAMIETGWEVIYNTIEDEF